MRRSLVLLVYLAAILPCLGETITVDDDGPADYQTIQQAIDQSWHGDVVLVRPGTYNESISFNGRAITVTGENPDDPLVVQDTIVNGAAQYGVFFDFGEGGDSVLTGLTVANVGIYCRGTAPTITKNVIRDCSNPGVLGENDAAPVIEGNTILANDGGIVSCHGPITDNVISENAGGIVDCSGPIIGNRLSGNTAASGGALESCSGEIAFNVIRGNYGASEGGGLYSCTGDIHHNIVAGNRAGSAGGGLSNCTESIHNNTIVGNIAGVEGGGVAACEGSLRNNIIAFNRAPAGGAVHGQSNSSYNNYWMNTPNRFAGGAEVGVGDIAVDPAFATDGFWDDNGTPADQSDDIWIHGEYHVQSQNGRWNATMGTWTTDIRTSQCIDAGSPSTDWKGETWPHGMRVNLGAFGGTAEASRSLAELGNFADLDRDGDVGWGDVMVLAGEWLGDRWPLLSDLNSDGPVDWFDYALLAEQYRAVPAGPIPPIPDPATWETKPFATSPYSVEMVATTAVSTDATTVEYYFWDLDRPGVNSGWIPDPNWQVLGLMPDTPYRFLVKARNTGNALQTDPSLPPDGFVITPPEDKTPPSPNPATWAAEPNCPVSPGTIQLVATTATDESGVEYRFECTSNAQFSSEWQDEPTYERAGLPKGVYTFVVRSRDKSLHKNTTLPSASLIFDLTPPAPDPMQWESMPREICGGSLDCYATMEAKAAMDDGPVQYMFYCATSGALSSPWQSSPAYTVKVGRRDQGHVFMVKARDACGNETGWSPPARAD